MKKKVTIYTIAEKLNISATTVYRALNNKSRISDETKEKVMKTAKSLGFKPNTLAQSLARNPIHLAAFIMTGNRSFQHFIINGIKQTEKELENFNMSVDYFIYDGLSKTASADKYIKNTFNTIICKQYDGILTTSGSPDAFTLCKNHNIPVALIVSDIEKSHKRFCVKQDALVAGQMAGEILGLKMGAGGKVAVASGYEKLEVHMDTLKGFLASARASSLEVQSVYYNKDNPLLAYQQTLTLLKRKPSIAGIYVNTANSPGVIKAILELGLGKKISLITSDLTKTIKNYIKTGVITATIFQNQYEQGRLGLLYLYRYIAEGMKVDDTVYVKPEIVLKANLNYYEDLNELHV